MLINPQEFLLKEIPDLHPLSLDYVQFWKEMNRRCIEGYWLGGYYVPSGLYFYTHMGTIQLNEEDSNTKSLNRPKLRDIELSFFPNFLICRGFSGFALDEEYSSHSILLNPDATDEYLLRRHPTTMNSLGVRKEYITPLTNLTMQHPYPKGRALYKNEAQNFMMMGSRGFGKALSLCTEILTPTGKVPMKDIKVGDKVLTPTGKANVLSVHPQGVRPTYRLTFSDKSTVDCDEEHLWTLYSQNARKFVTLSTKELLEKYKYKHSRSGYSYIFSLPQVLPTQFESKGELPLDPYLIGCLLGDGALAGNAIKLATDDLEMLDIINKREQDLIFIKDPTTNNYNIKVDKSSSLYNLVKNKSYNPIKYIISELGMNVGAASKSIPEIYKYASPQDRLELLRGLMDTDGSANEHCGDFTSMSKQLVNDVAFVARSLGFRVTEGITDRIGRKHILPQGTEYTTDKLYYRLFIKGSQIPFNLTRKKVLYKCLNKRLSLKDIQRIEDQETQCITIDGDDKLFLVNNFIPTHNSYMVGVGVIAHQWLTDGLTEYGVKREPILITVGAELAHYSTLLLQKTKLSIENMPGKKVINKKIYNSPLSKQYSGSWGPGKNIIAEYDKKYSGGWDEAGTLSTIAHRTFRDNSFADQGSRPAVLVLEEIGMFSNLKEVYTNTKDNLSIGLRKTGTLMMLGTGGDMEKGTLDAADMFYNPEAYDILTFTDEWENRGKVAYFIPAYIALNEFKDERGYSDIEAAKLRLQKARDRAKTSSGGSEALNKEIQYRPWVPSEMFLSRSANIFPVTELRKRLSEVQANNIYELLEKKVDLFFDHKSEFNGVNYAMNLEADAINKFPWNSDNVQGTIVLYELPHLVDGHVPPGAYIIGCDHFKENNNTGSSLAAIYVMKTSKYPSIVGYDEIVASYIGRPYMGASEVTEMLYKLSLFYGNAKVYFENTAGAGDIKSYFERMKRLDLLAAQPVTVFNKKASYDTNPSVIYGYPMSNDKIKWEAIKYVRNWLLNSREGDSENPKRNLDLITDPYLLQQLISFNLQGNFDAVMGLVGCVIGLEEMHNLSVRRDSTELSEVEAQFDKFLVHNKRLFNEKFSNSTTQLRRQNQGWF